MQRYSSMSVVIPVPRAWSMAYFATKQDAVVPIRFIEKVNGSIRIYASNADTERKPVLNVAD